MNIRIAIVAVMLLAGTGVLARASRSELIPVRSSFATFPLRMDDWLGRRAEDFDAKTLSVLGVDEYMHRVYAKAPQVPIGLYVGYYQSQRQGDTIHSPLNCLPGAGWQPVSKGSVAIPVRTSVGNPAERVIEVNRYVIQKGADRTLVLYWYQSHGRVIASEYTSKVYMVLDAMRTNRTDAAMVRVITPVIDSEGLEVAERRAVGFVQSLFPRLDSYLPS
jgi:EpsI family protein